MKLVSMRSYPALFGGLLMLACGQGAGAPSENGGEKRAALSDAGLVAAFGFDEGSGSQTQYAAGLTTPVTGQSWVVGKFGSGLEFEDAFLEIASAPRFDFTSAMTVSAWVLPKDREPENAMVVAKEQDWVASFHLYGETWYGGPEYDLSVTNWEELYTEARLPVTKWSHLAATYEGNQAKLYLNGELIVEREVEGSLNVTDTPLHIGGTSWGGRFRGRIDEVRLYERALSASEVVELMTTPVTAGATGDVTGPTVSLTAPVAGAVTGMVELAADASDADGIATVEFVVDGQTFGRVDQTPPYGAAWHARSATPGSHELRARATDFAGNVGLSAPVTVTVDAAETVPGLVLAFGFDEGSGDDVHDATGAGHDTVVSGQSWIGGKYGSALEFEAGFLEAPGSPLLDLTTSMTLSAWVLPKGAERADMAVLAKELYWDSSFELYADTWWHGPEWNVYGPEGRGLVEVGDPLPVTKWSHLAATYDGTWSRLYIDGELASETEFAGGAHVTDTPLRIGGTTWERYFRGRIDEVRIYNRVLSASEIVGVMAQPVTAGAAVDATAPTVSVTAPVAGAVSGTVAMVADASDAGGIAGVEFLVDGVAYGAAVRSPPYQRGWHSRSVTPGSHELRARATDFAGNVTVSEPVTVTVDVAETTPGLVLAFGFDEGTGEDVRDASGAGHDTVISGQSWIPGKYGSALEFEDSFLEVGYSHLLDLTTSMTLSAWVLPKDANAEGTLLAKEYYWDTSYELYAGSWWGGPQWHLLGDDGWGSVELNTRLPHTKWSHVAATYDGTWSRVYVDGVLAGETELESGPHVTETPLRIGGMTWERYFRGRIDEIRIYNRALSGAEIVGIMAEPVNGGTTGDTTGPVVTLTEPVAGPVGGMVGLAATATDQSGVGSVQFLVDGEPYGPAVTEEPYQAAWHSRSAMPGNHELSARATDVAGNVTVSAPVVVNVDASESVPGLVAAFGFDEGSGEDVHDATGAGHDGVLAGQSWVVGKYGSALEFEDGYVELARSHLLDLTTGMTLSAWVLPKAGEHWRAPVINKEHEWRASFVLIADAEHNGPDIAVLGATDWGSAYTHTRLSVTEWSHLAGTYEAGQLKLYINGELVSESELEGPIQVTDTPVRIGGSWTWDDAFRGRIDEVRIYNRALSGSELADVMAEPVNDDALADVTGPDVSLNAPTAGPVSGVVELSALASDASGIASVQFLVDGQAYARPVYSAPYEASWHSRSATAGSHELRARAVDYAGNVTISAPVAVTVDAANTVLGLIAAYGFDEGSGEDVHDTTGAGHDTVRSGQAWVGGRFGTALEFNGSFLEVEGSHLLDLTTSMTFSAWLLPKPGENYAATVLAKELEHAQSYVFNANSWHHGPDLSLRGPDWFSVETPTRLPTTRWSHLAGTYDGAVLRLYVDGQLVGETEHEGGAHVTDTPLRIGGMTWGNEYRGRLDELRIYNRALSASEIADVMSQPVTAGATADLTAPTVSLTAPETGPVTGIVQLTAQATDGGGIRQVEFLVDGAPLGAPLTAEPYQKNWHSSSALPGLHELSVRATDISGNSAVSAPVTVSVDGAGAVPGLVAAFGFDEGTGNDVHDASGAGHDTVLEGQSWVAGKFGTALSFDDNFLTVAPSEFLDLTTGMTLSAWVQPTAPLPDWPTVVMKEGYGNLTYALYAGSNSQGGPSSYYGSVEAGELGVRSEEPLALGLWAHVAATYDGDSVRVYVNGELAAESTTEASIATTPTALRIGGNTVWDGEWFYGLIDEVRIYNRALSPGEIEADMEQPVSGGVVADTTPPQVAVTAPTAGSEVFGSVLLRAQASDAYGIESVQFSVDGVEVGAALTAPPFETNWDSSSAAPGSHSIRALAFDRSGNSALSVAVVVTVDDEEPPTCDPATVTDGNPCTSDSCSAQGEPVFTPLDAGTSCSDGNRCNGAEFCSGAGACVPGTAPSTDATCDAVDDDCDGDIDEDYAGASTSCGVGACGRTGNQVCQNGGVVNTCSPGSPAPSDTTCNGIDDDCDGTVDEGYVSVATSCGVGTCAATGSTSCVSGAVANSCAPGTPASSDASCNGQDNDCDGSVDEDYVSLPTSCGASACAATGATSCVNGAVANSCTPGTPAANDATCDGIDNDCDGSIDEDFAPASTTCGVGACAATGATSCANGVVSNSCTPGVAAASDTVCDGIDNDCNGQKDEDFVPAATNCGIGACAAAGTTSCVNGALQNSCTPGTAASSDATCNGIDDDCSGSADEDYVAPVTYCGVGACATTGHDQCVAGQVQNDCQVGSASTPDDTCNNVDDDCDGSVDEDYVATPTACGTGACRRTGNLRCQAGSVVNDCSAGNPAASDTSCDGVDDDCNGTADEDYASQLTTCATGSCQATGETSCVGGEVEDSCSPVTASGSDETCDGLDNDCDGTADEGYQPHATSCGVGACARTGTTSCVQGSESNSCTPGTAATTDATCNGVDDDCDGSVDEGYTEVATTCGVGACARAGVIRCQGGSTVVDCTPGTAAASDTTCNGIDDDCNGTVDEDYVPATTSCGIGACAATGTSRCENGAVVPACTPGNPATSDETCDGIDNDCDGTADQDYVPEPLNCGVGACVRAGETRCAAGVVEPVCTAGTPALSDSSCNGVDDDCDGSVDENYAPLATTCGKGSCTAAGTTSCQGGQVADSCQPGTAAATDNVCNGLDDDCDGSVDENYVPQATSCGVGVCAATGMSECLNGAVVPHCAAGNPTGDDSDCNGVDDDCDGSIDEAYQPLTISCGIGACLATGTVECLAGVPVPHCSEGTPAADDASCDGIDNDCSGSADEDYVPVATSCGVGECARTGTSVCSGGQVSNGCTAGTAATDDANCNGKDDDCSGAADEDYLPRNTSCGLGACASTGTTSCTAGNEQNSCAPGPSTGSDDNCNNIDDDCDGSTDEAYAPLTTSCGRGACAAQGATSCSAGQVSDSCHEGTPAPSDANCNGIDEDCDGSADEEYLPQATVCGVGACRTTGAIACQAGQASDTCSPLPKTGTDDDCDGIDDDCDGASDEAYAPHCSGTAVVSCAGGALQTQECADQDACNGTESCAAAHCVAGTPVDTSDGNPCTADSCGAQGVVHSPLSLGTGCGQGRVCDGQGVCIGKPVITTQPSSVTVSPGGAATFGVTASGVLLSYQWRRLGQPIAGATGAELALPGVQSQDSGAELTVLVSNPAGSVLSNTALLTVTDTAGPLLTVDGELTRTAATEIVAVTGTALDNGVAAASLIATSSRFPGELAGLIDAGSGTFRIEVPVSNGTNAITLVAKDAAGNATQQSLVIKVEFSRLPRVTITEPVNGLETLAEKIDVRGSVRSSLPPESIRLVLGNQIIFPTGEAGEYSYEFEDVRLNLGPNLLSLRAETLDGTVTTLAAVLRREAGSTTSDDPIVSVLGGASQLFVKEAVLPINGSVTAKRCTASVTVNGAPAQLQGTGTEMRFSYSLALPPGDSVQPVEIIATDCDGRPGKLKYSVHHDDVAPLIEVALAPAPAVHNVSSTPYLIVGKVTEANLASVTSNQQSLGVLPGTAGNYDFTFAVPLTRGLAEDVTIEAVDQAGNQAKYVLKLQLDAVVDIEVIAPVAGAEIQTLKDPIDVDVVARIIGLPADHSATVRLDSAGVYPLTRADATFRGSVSVRGTNGSHSLAIQVKNGAGTIVAEKSLTFTVKDANSIPLEAIMRTPLNGASNVEANEAVVVELNRAVADPSKVKIEVLETVHGKRYKPLESGASFTHFTNIQLEDVNRDQEAVPGGMSYLPGDRLFVFYPARDYGYGGQVTVRVTNDGAELLRGQYAVRPLPTLITGFVADQFYNPIDGLSVRLDDVAVTTTSNVEGAFSFGFGKAEQAIPSGRHLLVINPGLKERRFGTVLQWVNTQAGRMEDLRIVPVPLLDASEPFRRISSNQASALLRGGDLELDLSHASLAFPDGAAEGDVHTNMFMGPSVGYPAAAVATPFLTYALQPMGIEVNGPLSFNFALPSPDGSNYIDALPELVLLVGLDPEALAIVPIGVGRVDRQQRRVRSARVEARRLDFIGMTPLVDPNLQSLFSLYAQGKVDLAELTSVLENSR